MKTLILVFIIINFVTSTKAQIKFGIKAGINFANMSLTENNGNVDPTKTKTGICFGIISYIPLNKQFDFQTGLAFSQKGYQLSSVEVLNAGDYSAPIVITTKITATLNYIDVPLNLVLKVGTGPSKFLFSAGPVLSYGVGGNVRSEINYDGDVSTQKKSIKYGTAIDQMKRIDLGMGFGFGFQYKRIFTAVNYNIGLLNLKNTDSSNDEARNYVFGVSVGFLFGKN